MKNIITMCAAILMTAIVFGQSPEKMSYQAVVRDGSSALVTSTAVGMQISILQGSVNGTSVYVETQTPTSNANGLVSLEIGAGTVVSGTFAAINWANGPYFIKTETDPTGGTNYTNTGTSQLLSVPYALHAKTAETLTGNITENDPVFGASIAAGITAADTAQWNIDNDPTNEIQQLSVSSTGDTLNLHNGGFVIIPGISAANAPPFYPAGSVFCATGPTAIVNVINPITGRIWMDRNLGASQVATSITDTSAYGDLYQWGRRSDGHQCRTSTIISSFSSSDQPAHGSFIVDPNATVQDWRTPPNANLWQGSNGINNPCPNNFRLPTEQELNIERSTWSSQDEIGAFLSALKLSNAGYRDGSSFGALNADGSNGYYWTSTTNNSFTIILNIGGGFGLFGTGPRGHGYSVRCIKD